MVRQWQELFWRRRYSHVELSNPDFVKLAEAFGCPAMRATTTEEVDGVIRKALAHTGGPVFVEFVVAKEDNVYPMIPAGQTVNEMIDSPVDQPSPNGQSKHGEEIVTLTKGTYRKERKAGTHVEHTDHH
jgi:hypothetical protein